jgi:hypothetical protein
VLGEASVYPGHPVTLAYLITVAFDSYAEATFKKSDADYGAALGSSAIPGAGGCVSSAIHLLQLALDPGVGIDRAIAWGDQAWYGCDNQGSGGGSYAADEAAQTRFRERWAEGQAQADKIKPLLRTRLASWK